MARAWFLNLEADDELALAGPYTPSSAALARCDALRPHVGALLGPGDVLIDAAPAARSCAGLEGRAWCPTPRALRAWTRAGARCPPVPALDVLRRVNHRAFCAALGASLPGAVYATTEARALEALAGASPTGLWVLKRAFGYAGRGRLVLAGVDRAGLDAPARAWIAASLRAHGGLQVEPWVARDGDFGLHGFVDRAGALTLGEVTVQRIDARGAWQGSALAPVDALESDERAALVAAARAAAGALHAAGYFGPFGVDAFRYRDAHGAARFNPRCEVNARYSMGWALGMGARRPDLEAC